MMHGTFCGTSEETSAPRSNLWKSIIFLALADPIWLRQPRQAPSILFQSKVDKTQFPEATCGQAGVPLFMSLRLPTHPL
jgi:hypothetical protein